MKKLKFVLAGAAATGLATANAGQFAGSAGFEKWSASDSTVVTTGLNDEGGTSGDSFWSYGGSTASDNETTISACSSLYSGTRAAGTKFFTGSDLTACSKVLNVSTGTDPLLRELVANGAAQAVGAGAIYIDTLVQFTKSTEAPTAGTDDKLLIYMNSDGNIVVKCSKLTYTEPQEIGGEGSYTPTAYTFTSGSTFNPNQWYRLIVKSYAVENQSVFTIKVGDTQLAATEYLFGGKSDYTLFPSLKNTVASVAAVGFAGEGKVDDLVLTTFDPSVSVVDFTLALNDPYGAFDGNVVFEASPSGVSGSITGTATTYSFLANDAITVTYTKKLDEGYVYSSASGTEVTPTSEGSWTLKVNAQFMKDGNGNWIEANTLAGAVTELFKTADSASLVLDRNLEASGKLAAEVPAGKTLTIDLNGKTFTNKNNATYTISNAGTLTITDTAGGGSIVKDETSNGTMIGNSGTLTFADADYSIIRKVADNDENGGAGDRAVNTKQSGVTTFNGGTFQTAAFDAEGNVTNVFETFVSYGRSIINKGTFNGDVLANTATNTAGESVQAELTVDGGTFNGDVTASTDATLEEAASKKSTLVTINNGTFNGDVVLADEANAKASVITIPSSSTAQFAYDETEFCVDGYKTAKVDPATYYTVAAMVNVDWSIVFGKGAASVKYTISGDNTAYEMASDAETKTINVREDKTVTLGDITYAAGYTKPEGAAYTREGTTFIIADAVATTIDFTLTLNENVSAVKYTINGGAEQTANGTMTISGQTADSVLTVEDVYYAVGYALSYEPATQANAAQKGSTASKGNTTLAFYAKAVEDPAKDLPSNVTPAEAGITNTELQNLGPTQVKSAVSWATSYGKSGTSASEAINSVSFDDDGTPKDQLTEDYLLNCTEANHETAKAAAETAMAFTGITAGTAPTAAGCASYGNGTVEVWGATTVDGDYAKNTDGATFFKAYLVKPTPSNK